MPQIIIQHILCIWTKRSRGGEGARRRNSIPSAVALPNQRWDAPFVLQEVTFNEYSNFEQANCVKTAQELTEFGIRALHVIRESGSAIVRFVRDGNNAACPSLFPHKDVFTLRSGDWGRVVFNGRHVDFCTGNWWYEQSTFNIGYFDHWAANAFTSTPPLNHFQELVQLR